MRPDLIGRPGPRLVDSLEMLADLLHPDGSATRPWTTTLRHVGWLAGGGVKLT